jgi:hypothetical protein
MTLVPHEASRWLVLVVSLPTQNTTTRMRVWRASKALGCGILRDGVYLLPEGPEHEQALCDLAAETVQSDGSAHLLYVTSADEDQTRAFQKLFDRTKEYAQLMEDIHRFKAGLTASAPSVLPRALKTLRRNFESIVSVDFFPGAAKEQVAMALAEAEAVAFVILSPDEPHAVAGKINHLDKSDYQGRTWATRKRPWIDRLASAWLIRRFIDPKARFLWLEKPQDCPAEAVGFDFDGATFTHQGARVTFEVLMASFSLEQDRVLKRLAAIVHYLDVGGIPVAEAAGLETILAGARLRCEADDALVREAQKAFDFLYAAFAAETSSITEPTASETTKRSRGVEAD